MVKATLNKIKSFYRANKSETLLLGFILFVGAFMRFYRIGAYMTFLGDEGRDAIVVWRLLTQADPILVGPGTSIGNMYLGPLYYYLIAPFMLLFNLSPIGPSIMVAFLSVLTILLIYFISREWFGKSSAIIASLLYAIAPTVIIYSRSSWNPNVMPFFSLICVYSIWQVWEKRNYKWLIILSVSMAMVLNSHYLGLLLAPALAVFYLLTFIKIQPFKNKKNKPEFYRFLKYSLLGFAIFCFLMSPLLIFDARHGWNNYNSMLKFFTERQTTVSAKPWTSAPKLFPIFAKSTTRLVAAREENLGLWTSVAMIAFAATYLLKPTKLNLQTNHKKSLMILFAVLGMAMVGLGVYKQEIYDHYYVSFFTIPFMVIGALGQSLISKAKIRGTWLVATAMVFLVYFNLKNSPLLSPPNHQMQRAIVVAQEVQKLSNDKPFNLAVIAERNYDDGYEYFLRRRHAKLTDIDPQNTKETITDQLFVICEMPPDKCDPTHNAKAEVANFGWSKIENKWEVYGTTLFKLVHSQI